MLICPLFVLAVLTALFALAWRFEPTIVVVLFGVSVYGTNSGGLSGSISRDSSTSNSQQTTHNNTSLTATNINLNTTQNTKIKGANLQATNQQLILKMGLAFGCFNGFWWFFCF
jgi:hypothetical protein